MPISPLLMTLHALQDPLPVANLFKCNFYSARNARIASAVLATAIPSVRLSVRHTPVLCQNDGT